MWPPATSFFHMGSSRDDRDGGARGADVAHELADRVPWAAGGDVRLDLLDEAVGAPSSSPAMEAVGR